MAIDTLKIARRLREAGFSENQAEAVVAAVQAGAEGADVATKTDIALLRVEMTALEERLVARIEAAKSELLFRMFQMILAAVLINIAAMVGIMFGFAKLLGH